MKVYALHCGGDLQDVGIFDYEHPQAGEALYNPYYMYVITHPQGNVLLDTGAHPTLRTDPRSRLGDMADVFEALLEPDDTVPGCLARIGMTPGDISVVVQSHLHFDHAGGLEHVRHAPVYVQQAELDFAFDRTHDQAEIYLVDDFNDGVDWRPLSGEHDLFGDGTLMLHSTPGHTAGHQSLWVQTPSQPTFLLCDAAYLIEPMRGRRLPGVLWNGDAMLDSWERIEAIERDTGARLIATHALDYETAVPKPPDGWE
jgi:glyoxylase-like metal-dependent hydrolase (beta-lactamase superfamily II)